ncbi:MAG TPA: GerMN domain-containing protein [Gaiellaceae bacterium]|nr:GerMN domain-containing protein [Gaiellaceae bacterium]
MKRLLALATLALAGGALAVAVTGCGSENAVSLGKPKPSTESSGGEQTGSVPTLLALQVWFARGDGLVAVRRTHRPTQQVATAAIGSLLDGPTAGEHALGYSSAVPAGTRLLGIGIRNGVATVDLTSEFQDGAGSRSMQMRLGQIVYTLTQFPTVLKVRFRLDGEDVNVFSSGNVVLDHPVGRSDYVNLLPAITLDNPAPDERVNSPVMVSGTANVFEANVSVEILNADGEVVGRAFTTASCGTGCRGTYSTPVTYKVEKEQPGTIVVHDDDAAGTGTPPHSVRIPVTLAP